MSTSDDEKTSLLRPSRSNYTKITPTFASSADSFGFDTLGASPPAPPAALGLRKRTRKKMTRVLSERRMVSSKPTDTIFQLEESPNSKLLEYLKPILISLNIKKADLDAFMMTREDQNTLKRVLISKAVVPDIKTSVLTVQDPYEIDTRLEHLVERLAKMTPKEKEAELKKDRITFENPNSILKPMFLCYHALLLNLSKASNSDLKSIGNLFKTIFDKRIFEMVGVTFEDVALYTATVNSFTLDGNDTYGFGKDDFNPKKKDFLINRISQSLSGIFLYATSHFYSCVAKSVPHMVKFDMLKIFADEVTKIAKAILWKTGANMRKSKHQEECFTLDEMIDKIRDRHDDDHDPIYQVTDDTEDPEKLDEEMEKVVKMILKKNGKKDKKDKGKLKIDYKFVEYFLTDLGELNINLMIIHSKLGKLPLQGVSMVASGGGQKVKKSKKVRVKKNKSKKKNMNKRK